MFFILTSIFIQLVESYHTYSLDAEGFQSHFHSLALIYLS
nr:MAG TPA: hypothetical protein [Caudoviricetes sp.]